MNGIVNFLKPPGMTSSDAVTAVRRILKEKHCGHMGTLDPGAAGVLLVGVGKSARLFDYFLGKRKRYRAEFTFGAATDTLDAYGEVTERGSADVSPQAFVSVFPRFLGEIEQLPPRYSAIKINGKKAYDLARERQDFDLRTRRVHIYRLEYLGNPRPGVLALDIECGGGTYIRSLARDMAAALGTVGFMSSLIRTACGDDTIGESLSECELKERAESGDFSFLRSPQAAVSALKRCDIPDGFYEKLCNGVPYVRENLPQGEVSVWCRGEFFGIGENTGDGLRVKTFLKD